MKMAESITNYTTMKKLSLIAFLLFALASLSSLPAQSDSYKTFIQKSGDIIQIGLPISALIMETVHKDKDGLKQFLYGFSTTFVVTHALKRTIRKKWPDPSEAYNAFPSGHTSVAFHAAAFLQKRYGWKYGIPAYLLSSFTVYSRVEGIDKKHDYWDVLAGATLGIVSAYLFTKKKATQDISMSLHSNNGNMHVGFLIRLQ